MRNEHDPLGKVKVPDDVYWGAHTQRAYENFRISADRIHPEMIRALASIKIATAKANIEVGLLDKKRGNAIVKAAQEVRAGKFDADFVVDVFQAGAGTPHHMNANEVIANRANELLGGKLGKYEFVHPNDHVNMGQSTNDVYPTAIRLAALVRSTDLLTAVKRLERALLKKAKRFEKIVKSGRTHLQDAVPITLGQEFHAYAQHIAKSHANIKYDRDALRFLHIGGSAVGTGINTHPQYRSKVIKHLNASTKLNVKSASDMIAETQSATDFANYASALKMLAIDLTKIANDLRLLSSGPMTGLHEITLPAVEPGSSIMPGKVNPSMIEELNMACFHVMGAEHTVELAAQAGQLELNVMTPLIAHHILHCTDILTNSINATIDRCINGLQANKAVTAKYFESSLGLATALNPYIGYEQAAKIVQEAQRKGKTIREIIIEKQLLSAKQLKALFDPNNITRPNVKK